MSKPIHFDAKAHTISLDRDLSAERFSERPDPPIPVDGVTFGVATMTENAPHGGEMHADGDEILYLISGSARIVFLDDSEEDIDLHPGDGLVVPKGVWHRVDIMDACQIVYVTPGPNNKFRPI